MQEFRGMALQSHGPQQAGRPWIGLEHTNKVWIIVSLLKSKCRKIQTTPKLSEKYFHTSVVHPPYSSRRIRGRGTRTWRSPSRSTTECDRRHPAERLQVWNKVKREQVNHSDFKSGVFELREHPVPQPVYEVCQEPLWWSSNGSFSSWTVQSAFFCFLQSNIGERFIYWSILIFWLVCTKAARFACADADIHISYSRLAQIIPVIENLIIVIHPLPPGFWTGGDLSLTVTSLGHLDFYGLIYSIYWCTLSSSNWTVSKVWLAYSERRIFPKWNLPRKMQRGLSVHRLPPLISDHMQHSILPKSVHFRGLSRWPQRTLIIVID